MSNTALKHPDPFISNEDYHGNKNYLSSSDLKLILQDSYQFYLKHFEGAKLEFGNKLALDLGSYIHSLVLEPEKTDSEFIVFDGRKQGKKYTEFKEMHPDKIIINDTNAHLAQEIVEAISKHEYAKDMFKDGQAEISNFTEINGVPIKVRADYLTKDAIIDLKTTSADVDIATFSQTIDKYMYKLSASLYMDAFGGNRDFYFVAAQKNPVNIAVYKLSDLSYRQGQILYKKAIEIYKNCLATGNWNTSAIPEI